MEYKRLPDPIDSGPRRNERHSCWALVCALGVCASVALIASPLVVKPWGAAAKSTSSIRLSAAFVYQTPSDVMLDLGMIVRGVSSPEDGRSFYNVPYAHAGRWEEPQMARWKGVRDARSPSSYCMQPGYPNAVEHCLSLNVMTPFHAAENVSFPVFVWFFGGGYIAGRASDFAFAGSKPVKHLVSLGLTLVVPDFRLGIFGYLASKYARRNSTGNWGTLDQVISLEWVSSYISKFGGDPTRVTVGGWSSGAASLSAILSMDRRAGLYHAAVLMSGGFTDWAVFNLQTAEGTYEAVLQETGCDASADCMSPGPPCACLLTVPADKLLEVEQSFGWAPIADGVVLRTLPYEALQLKMVHAVPILIGSTLEDAFAVLPRDAADADFKAWLQSAVPAKDVDGAFELYLGAGQRPEQDWIHAGFSAAYWAHLRVKADRGEACVARRVARRWPADAWQYFWDTRFWGEDTSGYGPGISHSSDQHFLFQKTMPKDWEPAARALQQAVSLFVHGTHPGKGWPIGGGRGMVFHKTGATLEQIRPQQCDFWDAIDGA